ncbi:FAD-dependent monooxygenase [Bacillus smithii]|uniref:FAD-dependent monooxygenase n=1 Tax=Bacillus smithii TaxID=1479 RepID=UPI002E1F1B07|nr:FAD-dependent monooxygenase [Bacillus smithii]MED1457000.1 FAD-dependent monooxygenase [Bacillus smithii]
MTAAERIQYRKTIVVGAGPIGLTAALALKNIGLDVAVLESESEGRQRPGSRAIYLHNATLKFFEEISPGLGFQLAENGIIWPVKRTFFRGEEVYFRQYAPPTPGVLPHFTSLPQVEAERYIYQACLDAGIEFFWNTPVKDVKTRENGVEIVTENGDIWKADYCIAADGARSVVRRSLGLQLEGPRTKDAFIVVDVKEDEHDPLPLERTFHYQHPAVGGRNVLFVPFAGGWRIDLQLLSEDDMEDFGGVDGVRKWLPKVMNPKYADRVTWVSTYQFYQAVANSYTDEFARVVLAGEAAHLFAPFGARGMNSGVPDAVLAARAIGKATKAETPEEAMSYVRQAAEERRTAGLYNRDSAGIALEHIQGNSPYMNAKRETAAFLVPLVPTTMGRWLDEGPYGPKTGSPLVSTKY